MTLNLTSPLMSTRTNPKVKTCLQLRIRLREPEAELLGVCAGYEKRSWRAEALATNLIHNIPQFALPIEEWDSVNSATCIAQIIRAAKTIYMTDKYKNRGEVGELMLFSIMREYYDSEPLVSKFYFKSAANDTVKGFDAVHVVSGELGPELWLGEVKFYTKISAAISDVLAELEDHLRIDFMRAEFMWVQHKMGEGTAHTAEIRRLLDNNTSLDEVFRALHIPILITYESKAVNSYTVVDRAYEEAIAEELTAHFNTFKFKKLPQEVQIHLVLLPLATKEHLLKAFDQKLKALQSL